MAGHRQVEDARGIEPDVEQPTGCHGRTGCGRSRRDTCEAPPDERLRFAGIDAPGDGEDQPFVCAVLVGVGVDGIHRHLLFPADHQHSGTQHDERPECRELRIGQGHVGGEGVDGLENTKRLGRHVVQRGGDGDGELGDDPAAGDVAEVDDAGRSIRVVPVDDDVVVGHVAVDHRGAQVFAQRLEPGERIPGRLFDQAASRGLVDMPGQPFDDLRGDPQVPLCRSLGSRVLQPGQARRHPSGDVSQGAELGIRELTLSR